MNQADHKLGLSVVGLHCIVDGLRLSGILPEEFFVELFQSPQHIDYHRLLKIEGTSGPSFLGGLEVSLRNMRSFRRVFLFCSETGISNELG